MTSAVADGASDTIIPETVIIESGARGCVPTMSCVSDGGNGRPLSVITGPGGFFGLPPCVACPEAEGAFH